MLIILTLMLTVTMLVVESETSAKVFGKSVVVMIEPALRTIDTKDYAES